MSILWTWVGKNIAYRVCNPSAIQQVLRGGIIFHLAIIEDAVIAFQKFQILPITAAARAPMIEVARFGFVILVGCHFRVVPSQCDVMNE